MNDKKTFYKFYHDMYNELKEEHPKKQEHASIIYENYKHYHSSYKGTHDLLNRAYEMLRKSLNGAPVKQEEFEDLEADMQVSSYYVCNSTRDDNIKDYFIKCVEGGVEPDFSFIDTFWKQQVEFNEDGGLN